MSGLATSRSAGGRADVSSCADIITTSQTIVKHANNFPQSPKIAVYANKIVAATVTCTAEEKTSLQAEVTSMEAAIVSVTIVLVELQDQIETLTGSTASSDALDAINAPETSTAAPAGRRDRIRKQLMSNL